jgi:hypothetical protein
VVVAAYAQSAMRDTSGMTSKIMIVDRIDRWRLPRFS